MRMLVIGGTRFVGRHLVHAALEREHSVTLFHRGQSGARLFGGKVKRVLGDRAKDLAKLEGDRFDVVVDTCAYKPGQVEAAVKAISHLAEHYVLISTISVYDTKDSNADGPLATKEPIERDDVAIDAESYGGLKVACENVLARSWRSNEITIVRPGVVVGPHDHTDRFTYWMARFDSGQPVVCPKDPLAPIQFVDARDLAKFVVTCAESRQGGTFDAVGPSEPASFKSFIQLAADCCRADERAHWIDPQILLAKGVQPWADLPMYVGPTPSEWPLFKIPTIAARDAGLECRPMSTSIQQTLHWWRDVKSRRQLAAGWTLEREAEFLESYMRGG